MTCIYCEGTGQKKKHKGKCGVCEGTGQVCDTCGESIPDDGDYLCTDCDTYQKPMKYKTTAYYRKPPTSLKRCSTPRVRVRAASARTLHPLAGCSESGRRK